MEWLGAEEKAGSFAKPHGQLRVVQSKSPKVLSQTLRLFLPHQQQEMPHPFKLYAAALPKSFSVANKYARVPGGLGQLDKLCTSIQVLEYIPPYEWIRRPCISDLKHRSTFIHNVNGRREFSSRNLVRRHEVLQSQALCFPVFIKRASRNARTVQSSAASPQVVTSTIHP